MKTESVVRRSATTIGLLACLIASATSPARAEVALRFSPADTTVTVMHEASLAVWIDEPIALRTVELWVSFDPAILGSVGGHSGQLFTDTGAFIFEDWEETEPGHWHGYAIVMAAESWVTGPGELYVWDFQANAAGLCTVAPDSLRLFDPDANLIPDVTLTTTTVLVYDSEVGVTDDEWPRQPTLSLAPNPFNPRTTISFRLPEAGPARLEIFDCRGRRVRTLWSGHADSGEVRVTWDGRDGGGHSLASGVYLFRLMGSCGDAGQARGVLLE